MIDSHWSGDIDCVPVEPFLCSIVYRYVAQAAVVRDPVPAVGMERSVTTRSGSVGPSRVNSQQWRNGALSKKDKVPKADHFAGANDLQAADGSFAVDLSEFQYAMSTLSSRFDDFADEVNSSPELAGVLPAGTGPVADVLGTAFGHRLSSEGGMDYAVRVNLDQLTQILDALQTTMNNYTRVEQEAAGTIAGEQS
jgi:hypothetical protein